MFGQGDREPWTHLLEYQQERTIAAGRRPRRRDAAATAEQFLPHPPRTGDLRAGRPAHRRSADHDGRGRMPPMYEGSPEAGRAIYLQLTHGARTPEQLVPVASTEDRTVPGPGRRPAGPGLPPEGDGPFPTVVFFHGGGWVSATSTPTTTWRGALPAAAGGRGRRGRLPPGARAPVPRRRRRRRAPPRAGSPATSASSAATTAWRSAGDSAGGNLAAVVAQVPRDEGPPLAVQLLIYPAVDAERRVPLARGERDGLLPRPRTRWSGSTATTPRPEPTPTTRGSRRCTGRPRPGCRRRSSSPPSTTRCATRARPTRAALEGGRRARSTVQRYDGMIHGFFDMGTISPAAQKAIEESCARFGELLRA